MVHGREAAKDTINIEKNSLTHPQVRKDKSVKIRFAALEKEYS